MRQNNGNYSVTRVSMYLDEVEQRKLFNHAELRKHGQLGGILVPPTNDGRPVDRGVIWSRVARLSHWLRETRGC